MDGRQFLSFSNNTSKISADYFSTDISLYQITNGFVVPKDISLSFDSLFFAAPTPPPPVADTANNNNNKQQQKN